MNGLSEGAVHALLETQNRVKSGGPKKGMQSPAKDA